MSCVPAYKKQFQKEWNAEKDQQEGVIKWAESNSFFLPTGFSHNISLNMKHKIMKESFLKKKSTTNID